MMKYILNFLFMITLLIFTGCSGETNHPNVVLLTLDTLRADAMGCYGNETIKTPHLDRLADEGVLFLDTICQIPATLTSHTAIMTGRNPKTTGVRFRTAHVPDFEETLAERFKGEGYYTAAFISSFVLAPSFGLGQGFDRYEMGSMTAKGDKVQSERRAQETIDQAIEYLNEGNKKPFFLWVHLYDPHSPYDAPEPYRTMYDPNYQGDMDGSVKTVTQMKATTGQGLDKDDLEHMEALYYGEVTYMDHHIGRLINKLTNMEILDNTIIIAMADHGENLGEDGRFFHGDDLYQPSIRIPFIMRYPSQLPQGLKISEMVQSIDVYPTLSELTDLPPIAGVEGNSLLPLIKEELFKSNPGYLETEADVVVDANKLYGLRTKTHKFINHSAHLRPNTPLGLFTEIPLNGPAIVMMRIKGNAPIRLMAHVRYRTRELYNSRDFQALSKLNTTVVHAVTVGTDPLHQKAMDQNTFFSTPEGWNLQMTPDIHHLARQYGESRGWPTDWMVIEGVGVDAAIPHHQQSAELIVDQFELYAPTLKFPDSPKYRTPFWVIEDFENQSAKGLADSGEGPVHSIESEWVYESVFAGNRQQKVTITFQGEVNPDQLDELFLLADDPTEQHNLLKEDKTEAAKEITQQCRLLLDTWRAGKGMPMEAQMLSPAQREALEALGYTN